MYRIYYFSGVDRMTESDFNEVMTVLPEERRKKALRYVNDRDRRLSAVSYMLLIYGMKECFGIVDFEIDFTEHGKPYIKDHSGVYFNISHSGDECVCIVSDKEIGIDIQLIGKYNPKTAEYVCSDHELDLIENSNDKAAEFTRIWTIKESYVKYTGNGISSDLKKIDTMLLKDKVKTTRTGNVYMSVVGI